MTEKEQEKIYNELRKTYTDEEIAESHIFSTDMTEEEVTQLQDAIKKRRENKKYNEEIKNKLAKFYMETIDEIIEPEILEKYKNLKSSHDIENIAWELYTNGMKSRWVSNRVKDRNDFKNCSEYDEYMDMAREIEKLKNKKK